LQNIRAGRFDGTDEAFLDLGYFQQELSGHDVVAEDVLIAGLGDENNQVGRACVAPGDLGPALVKADCFRFRLEAKAAVPSFIAMQLSAGASFDGGYYATGTTRQRIPLSVTGRRRIALPPVPEQRAIASRIDRETAKLDALISEAEQAISLLQERRTALISAAVTGKIDVRGLVDRDEAA
jgi:type I restriction enzyme S subunit